MIAIRARRCHGAIAKEMLARAALLDADRMVAAENRVPPRGGKGRPTHPRAIAMYLAVTARGLPAKIVARAAGVDARDARQRIARIEDRRDDASFDAWLSRLEAPQGAL